VLKLPEASIQYNDIFKRPNPPFYSTSATRTDVSDTLIAGLKHGRGLKPAYRGMAMVAPGGSEYRLHGISGSFAGGRLVPMNDYYVIHPGWDNDYIKSSIIPRKRYSVIHPKGLWKDFYREAKPPEGDEKHYAYYFTFHRILKEQVLRFLMDNGDFVGRCWLNGVPVEHHGRYGVSPGDYVFMVESPITVAAQKAADTPELLVDCYFKPSHNDPMDDVTAYREYREWAKPYLDRVIKLAPESLEADRARKALAGQDE
jgi:hypothetical protein